MSPAPRISVIVPGKDAAPYIAECLRSLTVQGVPAEDLEVIVVDDGSSDATAAIASSWAERFGRLRLLSNPVSVGVSAARNQALRCAEGEHIAFLDSDDWFARGHLAVLLEASERLSVDCVRTDVVLASGKRRELREAPVYARNRSLRCRDFIARGFAQTMVDFPNPFSGLYRRHLLDSGALLFDESLPSAEDREWNWRVLLTAETFAVVTAPGAYYRRGVSTSLTAVYNASQLGFIDSCAKTIAFTRAQPGCEQFAVKAGHNLFALGDLHLRRTDVPTALRRRIVDGIAQASDALTADELQEILQSFTTGRRRTLAPVLRRVEKRRAA